MTLFKLDDTMEQVYEARHDFYAAMKRSGKMYAWFEGENIPETCDNFYMENPKARLADFVAWTKRTLADRMRKAKTGQGEVRYKLEPGEYERPPAAIHRQSGVTEITDAVSSRIRRTSMDKPEQKQEPAKELRGKDLPIKHAPGDEPEDEHDNPLTEEEVAQLNQRVIEDEVAEQKDGRSTPDSGLTPLQKVMLKRQQ